MTKHSLTLSTPEHSSLYVVLSHTGWDYRRKAEQHVSLHTAVPTAASEVDEEISGAACTAHTCRARLYLRESTAVPAQCRECRGRPILWGADELRDAHTSELLYGLERAHDAFQVDAVVGEQRVSMPLRAVTRLVLS